MSTGTEQNSQLTPLKRAFLAIEELQSRLSAAERARHEPIAIIGAGCRFPGGVSSPNELWQLLSDGVDAIGPIPPERWDVAAYYDPDPHAPGKMSQRDGGFIGEVDRFDAQFFGIAPREATSMDPQQRLLLEVTWEALERAGLAPAHLAGSQTGVFVAMNTSDYRDVQLNTRGLEGLDAYFASGFAHSIGSGRISYVLGLQGPSITVDTACSSSLVAIHLAVQSLRTKETRLAIAGGVNLILSPELSITLSKYQMLAPDARCKFGDARADGFVRGEGCGIIVLKRLSDALADGDPIMAVIRGSALNQDGASSGLTAPNGPSQEAVVRAALADAGVQPHEIGYIEAHGTGTSLGDPIELQALGAVFEQNRPADQPLIVGSLKTNLGHLEAVAGIAGLLKLVLMLQHRQIPASLHYQTPNPHIAWDELPLRVPVTHEPWPASERMFGGVSSFGFSGTNAHIVLERAPEQQQKPGSDERPLYLLALSAKQPQALNQLAERYAQVLARDTSPALADVANTANSGRSHFAHRLALVATDATQAAESLNAFARGERVPGLVSYASERADPPRVAFLFTGQGSQYTGMGRELYQHQPVFRAALDRCAAILDKQLDRPLLELLFAVPESEAAQALDQTTYTQPALVALQVALAELWRSWGVEPAVLIGHSVGEYAAAIVAGVFSLEDGLALVATRGRLMGQLPAGGGMAAIFASAESVENILAAYQGRVGIAAYNGPEHTVVAGPEADISAIVAHFSSTGVRAQKLKVSHAFHSALLDPMLDQLEAATAAITRNPPCMRLVSNLTGAVAGAEITTPAYWRRHAREAVRFAQGIESLARLECEVLVEVGPHPTLLGMAQAIIPAEQAIGLPSLRRGRDGWQQLLESLALGYTHGLTIDWAAYDAPYQRQKVELPTYPFQRERYWVEAPRGKPAKRSEKTTGHPLLGKRLRSALQQVLFEQELEAGSVAYLDEHRVFSTTILPAAGFAEIALAAGKAISGSSAIVLDDLLIHTPLVVGPEEQRALQTVLTPDEHGTKVEIFSQPLDQEQWTLHATGVVQPATQAGTENRQQLAALRSNCTEEASTTEHYQQLRERGLDLGPSLQVLRQVWRGQNEAFGEMAVSDSELADLSRYMIHPALLDACLQLIAIAAPDIDGTYLPIAFDRLRLWGQPGAKALAYARLLPTEGTASRRETLAGEIRLFAEDGRLLLELDGLRLKRASQIAGLHSAQDNPDTWVYTVDWRAIAIEERAAPAKADFLQAPATIRAAAEARLSSLDTEFNLSHYNGLIPELETLSTGYIIAALDRLGWQPVPGEQLTTAELAERLKIIPAQQMLLERFLTILAEDGLLRVTLDGWEVAKRLAPAATAGRAETLVERYPAARGDIEITRRSGEGLADALRGTVDPLQVLFPGGSINTAEQLYRESPVARAYTALVGEAVAAAIAKLPAGRTVRVLEIGGGTGGATSAILPRMPADRTSYTFTDISPLFLARARETFATYPFVEYKKIDIELDSQQQVIETAAFDLIVAANVIHATADLRHTLNHVRGLLAPAGLLLLLEMTTPLRWIDISFGMTEGWWKFSDHDLRVDYPLLDRDGWLDLLREVGLEQPESLPAQSTHRLDHQQVVIARNSHESVVTLPAHTRNLLVFADAGGLGEQLAAQIAASGGQATLVTPGPAYAQTSANCYQVPPDDRDAIQRLLQSDSNGWSGVVYLWPLDTPAYAAANHLSKQAQVLGGALHLAQALVRESADTNLWLVTKGAQAAGAIQAEPGQATLWGFGKSLTLEHPELRSRRVDLDPTPGADSAAQLWQALQQPGEPEVALRGSEQLVPRLARTRVGNEQPATTTDETPVELVITERGSLDNLALRPATRRAPGPNEVEIRVTATALNFKDVLNVLGMYPGDPGQLGSECAGRVVAVGAGVSEFALGDRVVALSGGSFRSYHTVTTDMVAHIPANLTDEQAISIPIAYVTAAFALQHLGAMRKDERVLIHAAAGGVGLAAVHLAQHAGAEVYATAGSPAKHDYLRSLGVKHIFDSRSLSFAGGVREATGGEGVDLVLNSLAGDFVPRSLELLRNGGRFLELGKRDHLTATEAANLERRIDYHVIDWGDNAREEPALIRGMLRDLMASAGRGEIPPLPFHTFALSQVTDAFRYMAQARHIGKIVITHNQSAAGIRPDATYLITGGLAGLGLLTARWLAEKGARHLALMGRSGANAEARAAISELEQAGTRVLIITGDASKATEFSSALEQIASQMPPLRGIVHSAGVLDDGALTQQNWERFERVLAPKVAGAWNLHTQTAGLPLDFFVLYSSAASLIGSPGQGNHAAANSFLDALAHRRRADGLPALSINWGAWSEIGAAVSTGTVDRVGTQGIGTIAPNQGLELLEQMLIASPPQVGVVPIDWPVFFRQAAAGRSPFFAELVEPIQTSKPVVETAAVAVPDIVRRLQEAAPQRRLSLLSDFVRETSGHVLAMPATRIDDQTPLSALGLDSLMAVELRNLLTTNLNLARRLPATLVFDYPTVAAISTYLASEALAFDTAAADEDQIAAVAVPVGDGAVTTLIDELEDLSDDEVDRLLAEKLRG